MYIALVSYSCFYLEREYRSIRGVTTSAGRMCTLASEIGHSLELDVHQARTFHFVQLSIRRILFHRPLDVEDRTNIGNGSASYRLTEPLRALGLQTGKKCSWLFLHCVVCLSLRLFGSRIDLTLFST